MSAELAGKRVLVLSDNNALFRAIEFSLENKGLQVVKSVSSSSEQKREQPKVRDVDLIVVAMSSPTSEPVVALSRASLIEQVGQIPLLIISDRPFHSDSDDHITHLSFPFDIDGLDTKVEEILQKEP